MNNQNFYTGIGLGAAICGLGAMLMRPRKSKKIKSSMGKTLKTMSELADSVSEAMGWSEKSQKNSKKSLHFFASCANISRLSGESLICASSSAG